MSYDLFYLLLMFAVCFGLCFFCLNWLYNRSVCSLNTKLEQLEERHNNLYSEVKNLRSVTTQMIEDKMQPIEQALADVRGFTQTIDINIRLLIDKIDLAVKHNEQQ